ncbi:MAG: NADH-ubiquinone oxidoreductase-F iron-sulfur binding region domain-containing protein [Thermoanaerobaculia bacterium]
MLKRGADRERVLPLLDEAGGVTEASVRKVSAETGVPEADVWGTGSFYSLLRTGEPITRVCTGLTCRLFGADDILAGLRERGEPCEPASCLGQCDRAPATLDPDLNLVTYEQRPRGITPDDPQLPMNLAGTDDDSFTQLRHALELGPDEVIDQIEQSGLQGRGGAGFPAHFKWRSVRQQAETERYLVCNADEGEPGTFKDREVMLRRPNLLLEGLAITASTIGTRDIYIYIRGEFRDERAALERALEGAADRLADYRFVLVDGHGAYICGEETALIESLEGKRGMPRLKPPYPTEQGFRGKPTLMHNVETLVCVPAIVERGGAWFKDQGRTEAGSKLYCVSGHVNRPGVYELPLGVTLDELAEAAGGYDGEPRAFSPGGASSGFLPMSERQRPLDYRSLAEAGSMLGSAGVVVLNTSADIARAARWQLEFFAEESCGQCAPCRIGTRYLHQRLEAFLDRGRRSELQHVEEIAWEMDEGSICGLGMVAAKPLTSAMQHFPEEFEREGEP